MLIFLLKREMFGVVMQEMNQKCLHAVRIFFVEMTMIIYYLFFCSYYYGSKVLEVVEKIVTIEKDY